MQPKPKWKGSSLKKIFFPCKFLVIIFQTSTTNFLSNKLNPVLFIHAIQKPTECLLQWCQELPITAHLAHLSPQQRLVQLWGRSRWRWDQGVSIHRLSRPGCRSLAKTTVITGFFPTKLSVLAESSMSGSLFKLTGTQRPKSEGRRLA